MRNPGNILLFLFIAGFSPWNARADETGHGAAVVRKQTDAPPICTITQVSNEGKVLLLIRSQVNSTEFDSVCKELEEINRNRKHEKEGPDQQTEILEKLLTESLKTTTVKP